MKSQFPSRYSTLPEHAPLAPNPMRGWRGLGAGMLNSQLWPRDFRYNPIMIYFTGRRRGWIAEDAMGFLPWLAVAGANAIILWLLINTGTTRGWARVFLLQSVFLPTFAAGVSGLLVTLHFRRLMERIPLEEIRLTRISMPSVIHGVSVRPLAIQSIAILAQSIAHALLIIPAWRIPIQRMTGGEALVVGLMIAINWLLASSCAEVGAALALRAQLFIRQPWMATVRFLLDWAASRLGLPLMLVLAINATICLAVGPGFAILGLVAVLAIAGEYIHHAARLVLHECGERWADWWMIRHGDQREEMPLPWFSRGWEVLFGLLEEIRTREAVDNYAAQLAPSARRTAQGDRRYFVR